MKAYKVTYEIDYNGSKVHNVRFIDAMDAEGAEKSFIKTYQDKKLSIGKVISVELIE